MPTPSFGLALLLTTLVALGPLSTDLYLPALPGMVVAFDTDVARVQLTLSVFLVGFAVAQLFYGPMSDRYGRRPVMLFGLGLYLLASLACALARSVELLIVARFFQALGACAGPVLGRAIVRDVYGPLQAARMLAYISAATAIAPMLGPMLGGALTEWFGWRASFVLLVIYAAIETVAVHRLLGESNAHKDPSATRPSRILENFRTLLGDRAYVGYLLCVSFGFGTLFSFISGSSFVLVELHGLSPRQYGMSFGFVVSGYIVGTLLTARHTLRLGTRRMVGLGAFYGVLPASAMAVLVWIDAGGVWAILLTMFGCTVATGIVMPNATGAALAPWPKMTGSASALMGFVQMALAALVGIAVAHGYQGSARSMALGILLCNWAVLASYAALVGRAESV